MTKISNIFLCVTIILIIGCVIFLVVYYWLQWRKYSDEQMRLTWPRHINSCPDYWNHLGRGICQNKFEKVLCSKKIIFMQKF